MRRKGNVMAKKTERTRKPNPRIVVIGPFEKKWWYVSVELAGNDLRLCDRGEFEKTYRTRGAAMRAASKLRESLAGHDWFTVPIQVDVID